MKKKKVCVFTVVYPGCERYLKEYFESLNNQIFDDFDLFILNDGLLTFENYLQRWDKSIVQHSVSGTVAEIREQGIRLLVDSKYDFIIFADADDYFSPNRIYAAVKLLEEHKICFNDITTVTNSGKVINRAYFSNRLKNGQLIESDDLVDKNMMGLGNTAVRRSALENLIISQKTIAVDWMIFTTVLLKDVSAFFCGDAVTYYRQHAENTVGMGEITKEKLRKGIMVHQQNSAHFAPISERHQQHMYKIKKLKQYLTKREENFDLYSKSIKKMNLAYPFWWEEVKTLSELNDGDTTD